MQKKYLVQLKGIKQNKHNWRTIAVRSRLKEALKDYNQYTSGCCKRIKRVIITRQEEIIKQKYY